MSGADKTIQGFRYYLPRPYLVVPQRLDLAVQQVPAELVEDQSITGRPDPPVYLLGRDEQGQPILYDLSGAPAADQAPLQRGKLKPVFGTTTQLHEPRPWRETEPAPRGADSSSPPGIPGLKAASPPPEEAKGRPATDARAAAVQQLRIVYLPDFEQQMAVRPHNVLAKNEFSLTFGDGWQLTSVNSTSDATDVPIQLLGTISKMIGQTAQAAALPSAATHIKDDLEHPSSRGTTIHVSIVRTRFIAPGIYRLNKPSPSAGPPSSLTLLSSLGVPLESETTVRMDR
jgi:hypothetical protein